jgi:hypothetical protein
MMKKELLFIVFALISSLGNAQDEVIVKSYIDVDDLMTLTKADKMRADADRRMEEVSNMTRKIQSLQHDSSLSKRKAKNEIAALESKSWKKHVEASAIYEKSNDVKYDIYRRYLNRFWKEHEGQEGKFITAKMLEEQARGNYAQAYVYRRNTKHMNLGNVKMEKLTEANNLETAAIKKQIASLAACLGPSKTGISAALPDTNAAPPAADTAAAAPLVAEKAAEPVNPPVEEKKEVVPVVVPPVVPEAKKQAVKPVEKPLPIPDKPVEQTLFRIQIAANKAPFSFGELAKIFPGNYPVEIVAEAGWYKYQFIGVPLFSDASAILHECGAKGAFVVAYLNQVKLNIADAVKGNRELEQRIKSGENKAMVQETQYHLQFATSKSVLKPAEIARIYSGSRPVLVIMENGLYEYHLFAGFSLQEAQNLKVDTGLDKADIVAYKSAKRIAIH